MRIAVFYNLPSGGAKRTIYEQVKRLCERHHIEVYTLESANQSFCDIASIAQVFITPFRPLPLFAKPFRRLNQVIRCLDIIRLRRIEQRMAKRIDDNGYDVVLVHPCEFTISPAILQMLKTPSVYYSHDVWRDQYDPEIPRPYFNRKSWQKVLDHIDPLPGVYNRMVDLEDRRGRLACMVLLTNSYFTRECMYRIYGRAPEVSYNGVDIKSFRPLNLDRRYQVISVGAISPNKGFDFIINSLATISENKRPPLLIVSNSSLLDEKEYLENLAITQNVHVQFLNLITDDELCRQYNRAAITVYAPVMESFGLVPLESMACGTPVVGVAEGGVRETILHNTTGILTSRDPVEFGQAVNTLLNNPSLSQKYGVQSRDYVVKQWDWEQAIVTLENHLFKAAVD
jgi:glycosyltransferase involved in cell wall biosynthesis